MSDQTALSSLLPEIAAAAAETERLRRIDDSVIEGLERVGLFAMMRPRAHGGTEASPVDVFSQVREVSTSCASTGWIAAVLSFSSWLLVRFGDQAMVDVWGNDPHAKIAGTYVPAGQLRAEDGGYRLSGRWQGVTGVQHCGWLIVGAFITNAEGILVEYAHALVPTSAATMLETPRTAGLAAVSTHDVVVDDAFVPAHRVNPQSFHTSPDHSKYLRSVPALYRHSISGLYCAAVTFPLIGAAQGAYAAVLDQWNVANAVPQSNDRIADVQALHMDLGRASFEIDTAALQVERDLVDMHSLAVKSERVPTEVWARARRNQVLSVELLVSAAGRLLKMSGRRGLVYDHPLQRAWRDIHAGASNRANKDPDSVALFARIALGYDVDRSETTPVI